MCDKHAPYAKAVREKEEKRKRRFCLDNRVCPDCGEKIHAIWDDEGTIADLFCKSDKCWPVEQRIKTKLFGLIKYKTDGAWKGIDC